MLKKINKLIALLLLSFLTINISNTYAILNTGAGSINSGAGSLADVLNNNETLSENYDNINLNLDINITDEEEQDLEEQENDGDNEDKKDEDKEDNEKNETETDNNTDESTIISTTNFSHAKSGDFSNPPGTFKGRYYYFITEELLSTIKTNLKMSESELKMLKGFENNHSGLENGYFQLYQEALEFIKNDTSLSDNERNKILGWIDRNKDYLDLFMSTMVEPIITGESGGQGINPWNWQGEYQMTWAEKYLWNLYGGSSSLFHKQSSEKQLELVRKIAKEQPNVRTLYTPRSKMEQVYKPYKRLSKEDKIYQMADLILFMTHPNYNGGAFMSRIRGLYDDKGLSYKQQLTHVINALNDDLKLSEDEKDEIIHDIIRKDDVKVNSFIQEHKNVLYQYGITEADDLFVWLDYIKVGLTGYYYNGASGANNLTYRIANSAYHPKFNIFDNNYISNVISADICMYSVSKDQGKLGKIHKTDALIVQYIKRAYPEKAEERILSFAAIIKKMIKNKSILVAANSCY